ncbi:MAG TPA: cytochrome c biogenesis protein CcdA [Flexilinea sp.]|jgi:cytochrome c biogenesis protein CcdA|nr:cytochrome c biogenesis protein CcdA [Flexilinea sp.]HPJ64843.1 cytochrome c biogenesis protein CcdA [Flexilinea sp.]HPR70839.1 cytochrome c biogenesis protein CcdA [Flexilinea sp.]
MDQNLMIGSVFTAGILSFFSPCILPLLPVYFGILTNTSTSQNSIEPKKNIRQNLLKTVLFIFGIGFVFVLLGFGAGSLGPLLSNPLFQRIGGIIVILFGLNQMGLIRLNFMEKWNLPGYNPSGGNQYLSAFSLGLIVSLGWTPCIGPILASVLILAANSGTAIRGAGYMAFYTLGMAIPFIVIMLFADFLLMPIKKGGRWLPIIQKTGGALLVITGILMFFNRLNG